MTMQDMAFYWVGPKVYFVFPYNVMEGQWTHRLVRGQGTCLSGSFAASTTLSSSGSSELPLHEDYGCVSLSL